MGASPHSSFNLNRIRLACLVGCLEEYDNRLRAQITFLLQTKMYLTMTMTTLPSKRRKYDRGRSSSFGRIMILFLTTMLIKNIKSYVHSLRRIRADNDKCQNLLVYKFLSGHQLDLDLAMSTTTQWTTD